MAEGGDGLGVHAEPGSADGRIDGATAPQRDSDIGNHSENPTISDPLLAKPGAFPCARASNGWHNRTNGGHP